jgi:hypothetical protein
MRRVENSRRCHWPVIRAYSVCSINPEISRVDRRKSELQRLARILRVCVVILTRPRGCLPVVDEVCQLKRGGQANATVVYAVIRMSTIHLAEAAG